MLETQSTKLRKSTKSVWSPEQDAFILDLRRRESPYCWKLTTNLLNKKFHIHKTTSQCRERFRNYLSKDWAESEWTQSSMVLFVLLHRHYGNRWVSLTKFFQNKTDVMIKNLYYRLSRRVLKKLRKRQLRDVDSNRFYQLFCLLSTLEVLRSNYFPGSSTLLYKKRQPHEKVILKMLRNDQVTAETLESYINELKGALRTQREPEGLPVSLSLDFQELKLSSAAQSTILEDIKPQPEPALQDLFVINFQGFEQPRARTEPVFHHPMELPVLTSCPQAISSTNTNRYPAKLPRPNFIPYSSPYHTYTSLSPAFPPFSSVQSSIPRASFHINPNPQEGHCLFYQGIPRNFPGVQ